MVVNWAPWLRFPFHVKTRHQWTSFAEYEMIHPERSFFFLNLVSFRGCEVLIQDLEAVMSTSCVFSSQYCRVIMAFFGDA